MKLSIGILTKNEAKNIEACIQSARFADEVVVVDSGSSDNTVALASGLGAKVFHYPDWQGFAVQRNRLLTHMSGDYVFFLDADEIISPELARSIQTQVKAKTPAVGKIRWLTVAYGKPLHFVSQGELERLFPRQQLREFTGLVHEQAHLSDPKLPRISLSGKLLHYSRVSIKGSLEKLTQYAILGAAKRIQSDKYSQGGGGILRGMASGLAIFTRLYVLRLGFLSGGAGFLFCTFIALECFFRYVALYYDRDMLLQAENPAATRG